MEREAKQRIHDMADVRLAMEGGFDTAGEGAAGSSTGPAPDWLVMRTATPEVATLVTQFSVPQPAGRAFPNSQGRAITVSPDGTRAIYVANRQICVRSLSDLEIRPIAGTKFWAGGTGLMPSIRRHLEAGRDHPHARAGCRLL